LDRGWVVYQEPGPTFGNLEGAARVQIATDQPQTQGQALDGQLLGHDQEGREIRNFAAHGRPTAPVPGDVWIHGNDITVVADPTMTGPNRGGDAFTRPAERIQLGALVNQAVTPEQADQAVREIEGMLGVAETEQALRNVMTYVNTVGDRWMGVDLATTGVAQGPEDPE
jgi:hypothetical protein